MDLTQIIGSRISLPIDLQFHDIDPANPIPVTEDWRLETLASDTVGAAHLITVPAATEYKIVAIGLTLITTETTGVRVPCIRFDGGASNSLKALSVFSFYLPTIPASSTKYAYLAPGLWRDTAYSTIPVSGFFYAPLPECILKTGDRIVLIDDGNIDRANDTIKYRVDVMKRGV